MSTCHLCSDQLPTVDDASEPPKCCETCISIAKKKGWKVVPYREILHITPPQISADVVRGVDNCIFSRVTCLQCKHRSPLSTSSKPLEQLHCWRKVYGETNEKLSAQVAVDGDEGETFSISFRREVMICPDCLRLNSKKKTTPKEFQNFLQRLPRVPTVDQFIVLLTETNFFADVRLSLKKEYDAYRELVGKVQAELEPLLLQLSNLRESLSSEEAAVEQERKELRLAHEQEVHSLTAGHKEKMAKLLKANEDKIKKLEEVKKRVAHLEAEISRSKTQQDALQLELDADQDALRTLEAKHASFISERARLEKELTDLGAIREQVEEELSEVSMAFNKVANSMVTRLRQKVAQDLKPILTEINPLSDNDSGRPTCMICKTSDFDYLVLLVCGKVDQRTRRPVGCNRVVCSRCATTKDNCVLCNSRLLSKHRINF